MRTVRAEEALRIGLVDRVADEPLAEAETFAAEIASLDSAAVKRIKAIVGTADQAEALVLERRENSAWGGAIPSDPGL
jgi:enoyl-CoA hydratase/carnithine racemase